MNPSRRVSFNWCRLVMGTQYAPVSNSVIRLVSFSYGYTLCTHLEERHSIGVFSAWEETTYLRGGCRIGQPMLELNALGSYVMSTCYTNKNCHNGFYCSTALQGASSRCCRSDSGQLLCLTISSRRPWNDKEGLWHAHSAAHQIQRVSKERKG